MSCPPPRPPKVSFLVTPSDTSPAADEKKECELTYSMCLQCGTEMHLIKTKWVCPKCKWIIGCCD